MQGTSATYCVIFEEQPKIVLLDTGTNICYFTNILESRP